MNRNSDTRAFHSPWKGWQLSAMLLHFSVFYGHSSHSREYAQCRVSFLPIPARCFDLSFPVQPAHCYLMSFLRLLLCPFQRTNLHFPPFVSFGGWQLIEAGPLRRERRGAEAELWVPLGSLLFCASSGIHSWHFVRARLACSPIISC